MRKKPKKQTQLEFKKVNGWGGKRRGAGRPNRSGTVNHMAREKISARTPLHITLRLREDMVNLRCTEMHECFQKACEVAREFGLFVNHYSLESNHVHVFAEAKDNECLEHGMKSLGARMGLAIRKACGGRGPVFKGRYHVHVLKTPAEVKHGLAYVLLNHSKHVKLIPYTDLYSSGRYFADWRKLLGREVGPILEDRFKADPLPSFLSPPKSWLAKQGWQRARS